MKMNLFTIGVDDKHRAAIIKAKLSPTLRIFADNPPIFYDYADFPSMAKALFECFSDNTITLIFASLRQFSTVKTQFINACHLKTYINEDVKEKIKESFPDVDIESEFIKKHCLFPVNSEIFCGDGGIYSGFRCRSGNKHIMLLPLDKEHTVPLVTRALIPTLSKITGVTRAADDLSIFNDLCLTMRKAHITVAVANTNNVDYIKEPLKKTDSFSDLFKFSDKNFVRAAQPLKPFIGGIAKAAAEETSCVMGIAISNVIENILEDRYSVAFSVASSAGIEVSTYEFDKTDILDEALSEATNKLFTMLRVRITHEFNLENDDSDFETF